MDDPVTAAEASLLSRDGDQAPWQQVLVLVLAGGLTREALLARIGERIGFAPRFRRRVTGWPIPIWADDPDFNLAGHVDEATLATGQELPDWLAGRLAIVLPRNHPLWEVTLVHGLAGGAQAVVARINPAVVDGYDNIHLFQELLDEQPDPITFDAAEEWEPAASAGPQWSSLLGGIADPIAAVERVTAGLVGLLEGGVRTATATPVAQHLGAAEVDFETVAALSQAYNCTVHDVLVSLACAGVRAWLAENGRPAHDEVALIPLAITEPQVLASAIGCRIAPAFDRLPLSVADPMERLDAVATLSRARRDSGHSVGARDLIELAGFAPATLHAVAAGTVSAGRPHTVVVANVPGPDRPRYLGTVPVRQVYAVTAITDSEQVNVAITSYGDRVSLAVIAVAPVTGWRDAVAAELAALKKGAR